MAALTPRDHGREVGFTRVQSNCEHEVPCKSAFREPWCRPCLLDLVDQQNDLNERLYAENERLRASYGWLDERFPVIKAEAGRLQEAIEDHRDQVTSWNLANREPAPADKVLWAVLDPAHNT